MRYRDPAFQLFVLSSPMAIIRRMGWSEILILAGGFAGGFVSGLTGFGTGLTALPIWLSAVSPVVAAPLVVICSVAAQLQTFPAIWHAIRWRRVAPFVLTGLAGVPIGTLMLAYLTPRAFRLFVGCCLVLYCSFMLLRRTAPVVTWGGRAADGVAGLGGGILGGLAGLSGVLPTIWASLRGWDRDIKRGIFQSFNLSILLFAMLSQAIGGFITLEVGKLALIALPGTFTGGISS